MEIQENVLQIIRNYVEDPSIEVIESYLKPMLLKTIHKQILR